MGDEVFLLPSDISKDCGVLPYIVKRAERANAIEVYAYEVSMGKYRALYTPAAVQLWRSKGCPISKGTYDNRSKREKVEFCSSNEAAVQLRLDVDDVIAFMDTGRLEYIETRGGRVKPISLYSVLAIAKELSSKGRITEVEERFSDSRIVIRVELPSALEEAFMDSIKIFSELFPNSGSIFREVVSRTESAESEAESSAVVSVCCSGISKEIPAVLVDDLT
jgi:hypothetical protein